MKIFPCIVAPKSHKVICYVDAVLLSLLERRPIEVSQEGLKRLYYGIKVLHCTTKRIDGYRGPYYSLTTYCLLYSTMQVS